MRSVAPMLPRDLPREVPDDYDLDLTLDIYDKRGVRLFAMGSGGFHIPVGNEDHYKALEKLLTRGLKAVAHFKESTYPSS